MREDDEGGVSSQQAVQQESVGFTRSLRIPRRFQCFSLLCDSIPREAWMKLLYKTAQRQREGRVNVKGRRKVEKRAQKTRF